jgi:hypothetical protein
MRSVRSSVGCSGSLQWPAGTRSRREQQQRWPGLWPCASGWRAGCEGEIDASCEWLSFARAARTRRVCGRFEASEKRQRCRTIQFGQRSRSPDAEWARTPAHRGPSAPRFSKLASGYADPRCGCALWSRCASGRGAPEHSFSTDLPVPKASHGCPSPPRRFNRPRGRGLCCGRKCRWGRKGHLSRKPPGRSRPRAAGRHTGGPLAISRRSIAGKRKSPPATLPESPRGVLAQS